VSLVALDAILADLRPAGSAAAVDEPVFDNALPRHPPRSRPTARKRRRTRRADVWVH